MDMHFFRDAMRYCRKAKELTHEEMAAEIGWTKTKIQQVEAGQIPEMELAIDIATFTV